jgi:hypothetical protein
MDKKFSEKLKEGVSVREIEDFARKYTTEVFSILAIIVATASSCWDFFLSGPKMATFFAALGCILVILFPMPIEKGIKNVYRFMLKQEKSTQIILGVVKVIIALFIPFLLFTFLGLLAGTAYHYYIRHSELMSGGGGGGENRFMRGEVKEGESD